MPGCLIPRFDGAILSWEWKGAYGTSSSRERHDHARCQSSNTAIAGFARATEPGTRHQPQDGGEVAEKGDSRRYKDRADGTSVHRADAGRSSDGRRVPPPHALAAGRLPLCPATVDPAPDTVGAASVPAAAWYLTPVNRRAKLTPYRRPKLTPLAPSRSGPEPTELIQVVEAGQALIGLRRGS